MSQFLNFINFPFTSSTSVTLAKYDNLTLYLHKERGIFSHVAHAKTKPIKISVWNNGERMKYIVTNGVWCCLLLYIYFSFICFQHQPIFSKITKLNADLVRKERAQFPYKFVRWKMNIIKCYSVFKSKCSFILKSLIRLRNETGNIDIGGHSKI